MRKPDKKNIPIWAQMGHQKPSSRREFLAYGLLPFMAAMTMPNWVKLLLPNEVLAQTNNCPVPAGGMIPMITVNLAGGAGLMANILPLNSSGDPLPSYNRMGLGNTANLPVTTEFGGVRFPGTPSGANQTISRFLQGVRDSAGAGLSKTAFVWLASRSGDDTVENRADISGLAMKAGLLGSALPNLGSSTSATGGRHRYAVVPPPSPLVVSNFGAIAGSLGYAAAAGSSRLNNSQRVSLAKLISKLNNSQVQKLANLKTGAEVKTLLECAGIKNVDLVSGLGGNIDPRTDTAVGTQLQSVWAIDSSTPANNRNLVFSTMAYNALKKNCGPVNLVMGGYDYHDGSRATGDNADLNAGILVGRLLATADALQTPLFIYVTTDGSVVSAQSDSYTAAWTSDRGIANASYILYYDPSGRKQTSGHNIGFYNDAQASDENFVTGGSIERAAAAVFANYLELNNKLHLFPDLAGRVLDPKFLNQVIKF